MEIDGMMKLLSSKTRIKLLTHFYTCCCHKHNVGDLVKKVGTTQANVSKQLNFMHGKGIIFSSAEHKVKYYQLDHDFKKDNATLLDLILLRDEFQDFRCKCSLGN